MNGKLFVDTSAWLAYSSQKDPQYKKFVDLFNQVDKSHSSLYTSNDVIDETYTRLRYDLNYQVAQKYLDFIKKFLLTKTLIQLWTDEQIQSEAINLLNKYQDHKLSLTDATSAVLMRHFNISTVLTLDSKHFTIIGFKVLPLG